jgi:hypothetical protein
MNGTVFRAAELFQQIIVAGCLALLHHIWIPILTWISVILLGLIRVVPQTA